jgi:type IV pilus assembly protein PilB
MAMAVTDAELKQVLTDLKYLPSQKLQAAEAQAEAEHASLYDTLVQHDYLNEDDLGKVVAYHHQLPYVALDRVHIPENLLRLLPASVAQTYQTVPFEFAKGELHIATARPESEDLFAMLAKKVGAEVYRVSYTTEPGIENALHYYKPKLQGVFDTLLGTAQGSAAPVAALVDACFEYGYDARASDIHIEPLRENTVIRFRIDGVLHDEVYFPKKLHAQIVTRLKVLARLRTDEHLSSQDGRLHITIG